MSIVMIIGFLLMPVAWLLMGAANKAHRDETGVNMPTRSAMRNIRRTARKKGIPEEAAYSDWLVRQQKRALKSK